MTDGLFTIRSILLLMWNWAAARPIAQKLRPSNIAYRWMAATQCDGFLGKGQMRTLVLELLMISTIQSLIAAFPQTFCGILVSSLSSKVPIYVYRFLVIGQLSNLWDIVRNLIPFQNLGLQSKTEALFRKMIINFFVAFYPYFTMVKFFRVRSPLRSP